MRSEKLHHLMGVGGCNVPHKMRIREEKQEKGNFIEITERPLRAAAARTKTRASRRCVQKAGGPGFQRRDER